MKKSVFAAVALLVCSLAAAQNSFEPAELRDIFNAADSSVSPSPVVRPLVAVSSDASDIAAELLSAGALPACIGVDPSDYNACRDLAATVDGFVLGSDFDCEAGLMLLKALADRNVPVYGHSEVLDAVNRSMRHRCLYCGSVPELVAKAAVYKRAKAFMASHLCIDSHSDLALTFDRGQSLGRRSERTQVSLQKMNEGGLSSHFLVAYVGQGALDPEATAKAVERVDHLIDRIYDECAKYSDYCETVTTSAQARDAFSRGKKAIFIGIENAYGLGSDIRNVKRFADRGVTYITLSHTGDNLVCHSSGVPESMDLGLTAYGRKVVREMNRLGIIVDLSHTSDGTFRDVCKISKAPFICSHSGARAVFNHPRGVTDEQLRAVRDHNGVVQVYIVDSFMAEGRENVAKVSVDDFVEHFMHCVEVAGIDHVGIGWDSDGGGGGLDMDGDNDMINVTVKLIEAGLDEADLAKVWGENLLRVLDDVQRLATSPGRR